MKINGNQNNKSSGRRPRRPKKCKHQYYYQNKILKFNYKHIIVNITIAENVN